MSESRFTAQEMLEVAEGLVDSCVADNISILVGHGNLKVVKGDRIVAMLRYAAGVVERSMKMIRPCNLEDGPCVPSDSGYCYSCDVPKHNEPFNYILRGDAGKKEQNDDQRHS